MSVYMGGTMANPINVKGRSHYEARRASKQYGENRLCDTEGCKTTLSKYNKETKCFLHAPARQGRIRGWQKPK